MRKGTAKDVLMRLRWKEVVDDWSRIDVVVRHHGAPADEKHVAGDRISGFGTSFFELDHETSIPYHRIKRIYHDGGLVYERVSSSKSA